MAPGPTPRRQGAWPGLVLSLALLGFPASAASQTGVEQRPDSALVSGSTRAALEIDAPLPELSRFLPDGLQSQAGVDWERSWDVGAAEGRRLRRGVYLKLRQSGFEVDSTQAHDAVASVSRALESVGETAGLPLHVSLPPHGGAHVGRGRRARPRRRTVE